MDAISKNGEKKNIEKHDIEVVLKERKLTQVDAAKLFGASQPRVSNLLKGRIDKFTVDTLVNWLSKLDKHVELVVLDEGTNHFQGGKYAR